MLYYVKISTGVQVNNFMCSFLICKVSKYYKRLTPVNLPLRLNHIVCPHISDRYSYLRQKSMSHTTAADIK